MENEIQKKALDIKIVQNYTSADLRIIVESLKFLL